MPWSTILQDISTATNQQDLLSRVGEVSATPTVNTLMDRLKSIYESVDGLELSVDNIDINTDQVEAKLDSVIAELQDVEADVEAFKAAFDARDLSTETTLATMLTEATFTGRVGEVQAIPTANTILGRLKDIADEVINGNNSSATIEAKLQTLIDQTDTVESLLTTLTNVDFATETTLSSLLTKLTELDTAFDAEDFATAANQALAIDELQDIEAAINAQSDETQALIGEVSATPTVNTVMDRLKNIYEAVDGLELSVDNIDINTDQVEAKLDSVIVELQDVEADVEAFKTAFDARDLATETTQATLLTEAIFTGRVGEVQAVPTANTILGRLKDIADTLSTLDSTSSSMDSKLQTLINQTDTVESLLTTISTIDYATETTLSSVLSKLTELDSAFDAEDFATETTLAAFKAESKAESDATQALIGEVSATPTANTIMDRLKSIYESVDGLELSVDNIDINTDQVEAKLDSVILELQDVEADVEAFKAAFDARDLATETTQATLLTEAIFTGRIGEVQVTPTQYTLLGRLKDITDTLASLDTTSSAIDSKLQTLINQTDTVESLLTTISTIDYATETTLSAFKAEAKAESDETQALIGEVSPTPTVNTVMDRLKSIYESVDGVEASLANIDANTDQVEAKLDSVVTELQDVEADVEAFKAAFDARDLATETTLATMLTEVVFEGRIGEVQATPTQYTLLGRLKDITDTLTTISNIDFATETTLAAFKTEANVDATAIKNAVDSAKTTLDTTLTDASQLTGVLGQNGTSIALRKNPLPASTVDQTSGHPQHVNHFGAAKVGTTIPLVSGNFPGPTLNRTLWTEIVAGTGNLTFQKGVGDLHTGASASSSYTLRSRKEGRFIAGQVTVYQAGVHPVGTVPAGAKREWGLLSGDGNDGLFFREDSTGFYVVSRNDGVETAVEAANFSDEPGYTVSDQNRTWRIEYSAGRALFYDSVQGRKRLLHEKVDSAFPLTSNLNLPGYLRVENTSNTTDVILRVRGFSISLWGELPRTDIAFVRDSINNGTLPSGAAYTVPAVPDANPPANVIDSGYIPRYQAEALFTHVQADTSLKVYVIDSSDTVGTTTVGLTPPTITTAPFFPSTVKAALFKEYTRVVVVNDSGTDATNFFCISRVLEDDNHNVLLSIDQPIFGFFPAEIVQAISKAQNPDGIYVASKSPGVVSSASSDVPLDGAGPVTSVTADFNNNEFTATAHGLANGDVVVFDTDGTLPLILENSGVLQEGVPYWVVDTPTADTFTISSVPSTTDTLTLITNGTGNHTFRKHGVFCSPWFPLDGHVSFVLLAQSNQPSASLGLGITFSPDALDAFGQVNPTPGITRTPRFTYHQSLSQERTAFIHMGPSNQEKYARIHYVNGINAQDEFHLVFSLAPVSSQLPVIRNDAVIDGEVLASVTKSFVETYDSSGGGNKQVTSTQHNNKTNLDVNVERFGSTVGISGGTQLITNPFVLNATTSTRLDLPDPGTARVIEVVNDGNVHAFVKPNDSNVTEISGRPLFIGGNAIYALEPGEELYAIAENIGANENVQSLIDPLHNHGGTATNTVNAELSDDIRAVQDAEGETITMENFSFTHTAGFTQISKLEVVTEARRSPGASSQTVAHQESVSAQGSGGASINSPAISAGNNQCYVAVISNGESSKVVNSVSGLGLTWTEVQSQIGNTNKAGISVWIATGSPTSAGSVTASFASSVSEKAISVHRYSGVDQTSPVQASTKKEAAGSGENNWSLGPITGTATYGLFFGAINGQDANPTETTTNLTAQRADISQGAKVKQEVWDGTANASNTFTGNHGGSTPDWVAVAMTLLPAPTGDPEIELSYEFNAVEGATKGTHVFDQTVDVVKSIDITADESWTAGDIANLKVISTMTKYEGAALETDVLYLRVTESSAGSTRVIVTQARIN